MMRFLIVEQRGSEIELFWWRFDYSRSFLMILFLQITGVLIIDSSSYELIHITVSFLLMGGLDSMFVAIRYYLK